MALHAPIVPGEVEVRMIRHRQAVRERLMGRPPKRPRPAIPLPVKKTGVKRVMVPGAVATVAVLPRRVRIIIAAVALKHGVSVRDILEFSRRKDIVRARQEAMFRIKKKTDASFPLIGRYLGNRDYTTVLHGFRVHEARMEAGDV